MEPCQQEGPPSGAEEGGARGGDGRGEAGEISEDGGGVGGPQARGRSAGVAGAEEVDELSPPLRFLSLDEEAIKNIQSVVRRKQEHKKEDEELEELNKQIGSILGGEDLGGECAQDAPAAPPACASDGQGPCLQASSTPVEGENGTNGGSHEVPPCEETDLTGGNDVPDADQSSESCGADAPCPLAGAQGPPDSELESTENGLETEEPVGVGGSAGQRAAYASEEPGLTPGGKAPGGGTRGYQASGLPIDQVMDLMESLRLPIGYGKTKRPGHPKGSIGGNQRQQGSKSSCRPASAPVSSKGSKAKRLIRELERKPKLRDLEGANPGASDARRAAVAEGTRSGRFSGSGSNGELVSQSALEGAGVAVDRNSSGLLDEQEFIRLMHMEQSLEEELLGIDRTLTAKLSMTRLAAGTMAVTAAEAAAAGSPSQVHGANGTPGSSLHSVQGSAPRKPSGLSETQRTQGREPPEWLGYAARSKVARARNPPDVPFENPPQGHVSAAEVLYPPPPSEHCPSHAGHVMDCLQGWSSPRTRTAPRNWSTVYDRTYAWKKRAENKCVLEKKRKDDDSLKECTFSPNINRKGSPKAECESMSEKSDRSMLTYFQDDNSHIKVTEQSSAKLGKSTLRNAQTVCSDGSQGSTSLEACLRLYTLACHHRWRQQECLERRLLEERQQMAASAPRPAPLPEKIYGSGCGQGTTRPKLSPLPTGMEECTFHPKTNVQRVLSKSGCLVNGESQLEGAHCHRIAGGVDGAKPVPAVSEPAGSEEQGTVSGSHTPRAVIRSFRPQPASSTLDDLNDTFTVSVSEVDVDDFLKRQTTFAENREQKLQELRRTVVPGLQMSPGSRRILEQREKRLSRDKNVTEQNLEGEGGDAGLGRESEAGNSASSTIGPCKGKTMGRGSRVPYPGCTFRPKISWRAQKKPSRSLDELSSAELHRREANLEAKRAERKAAELEGATFKPDLSSTRGYNEVAVVHPTVSFHHPGLYMASLRERQARRHEQAALARQDREREELWECTFRPRTRSLPSYILKRARSVAAKEVDLSHTRAALEVKPQWL